jgi:hypothetical protein
MCCIIHVLIHRTLILSHDQWVLHDLNRSHHGLLLIQKLFNKLLLLPECGWLLFLARELVSPTIW